MKTSQKPQHLGESIALGLVLVGTTIGVFVLMMLQTGTLQ